MTISLESLEMTPEELQSSKEAVQKMAYFNWLEAGAPDSGQLEFWLKAQREWIEHNYVPHRTLDGQRPNGTTAPAKTSASERRQEPSTSKSRRIASVNG